MFIGIRFILIQCKFFETPCKVVRFIVNTQLQALVVKLAETEEISREFYTSLLFIIIIIIIIIIIVICFLFFYYFLNIFRKIKDIFLRGT